MTALKPRDVAAFLASPDARVVCALVYGPEQGLVHERAASLARVVAEDLSDPWRVVSLSEQDASDAALLTDEAAAQSFLGGRRVVRVRNAGQGVASAVASLLAAAEAGSLRAGGLVVIEAGDLKKTSALRKACEASPAAVAIPCYPETARDTKAAIRTQCREGGLGIAEDAADLLAAALGEDRGLLRQEVEKLILFKGPGTGDEITATDVRLCLADAPGEDSFAIAALALGRDPGGLSRAMAEAEAAGTSVITLLRLTQGRILRLMPAAQAVAGGEEPATAIRRIKPPVFWAEQDEVKRELSRWPLARLEAAAAAVYAAEAACKRTGAPAQAIAERALLSLAAGAPR